MSKAALQVTGVGAALNTGQAKGPADNGLFDQTLKQEDALYNHVVMDKDSEEHYSNKELEDLRLGQLQCPFLEQNQFFIQLRGKLVNFYKRLEQYNIDPSSVKGENIHLKKTLCESLKKLLRVVILTDDKKLQSNQLNRLYHWFFQKEDSLMTKEAVHAQKMRDEQVKRRKEMKAKILEQQAMTHFPPIKGQQQGYSKSKRDESYDQLLLDKTKKQNNLMFSVSRNDIYQTESKERLSTNKGEASPSKAYSSQTPGKLSSVYRGSGAQLDSNYLTQQQEDELQVMIEKMQVKDKEYGKHYQTIKQTWLKWGKSQSGMAQRAVQVLERATYGSNFAKLGARTVKSRDLTPGLPSKKFQECYDITEQQFLNDPTSDEEEETTQESKSKIQTTSNRQINAKSQAAVRRFTYDRSSGDENSSEDDRRNINPFDRQESLRSNNMSKVEMKIQAQASTNFIADLKQEKSSKLVDISYEDYLNNMNKSGIIPDTGDSFLYQSMTKQAANLLNQSHMKLELQKETSRRKIERLRWYHNSIINGTANNGSFVEENLDNPLKNGGDNVLTLSVFSRPCNNTSIKFQNNTESQGRFSLTATKGLFNAKVLKDNQKKILEALAEAEKLKSKSQPQGNKKKAASPPPPNKQKGKDKDEPEETKKPKETTRSDIRILSELRQPFKAENYDYRISQYREAENLKYHLASNNLNVSADVIHKAILLPEEDERDDINKNYPKIQDFLLDNPFAKPKKKKKSKKKKRR